MNVTPVQENLLPAACGKTSQEPQILKVKACDSSTPEVLTILSELKSSGRSKTKRSTFLKKGEGKQVIFQLVPTLH